VFADGAARYLTASSALRSAETCAFHVRILLPYIGTLPLEKIHDGTLEMFVEDRLSEGVSPTTVNRSLEVVRTVLMRCARVWRDDDGRPWLEQQPPLITMLPERRKPPHPLSWEEQDRLMEELPRHLQELVLFAVNSGARDENIVGLRWAWEQQVPEAGRSVFVIPPADYKTGVAHVLILNDAAWSIVQSMRGRHPVYVFSFRGHRMARLHNSAWRKARERAGLRDVRIHDLRHTYASRLRLAGVAQEDRNALMGHKSASIPEHYASADVGRLIELSNRVLNRGGTRTLLRVVGE